MFRKFYATKKTVNNGLRLELNTPFDFQLLTIPLPAPFFNSKVSCIINKLFRVSSQTLEYFKVCGGLKFRFEALNIFNYIK